MPRPKPGSITKEFIKSVETALGERDISPFQAAKLYGLPEDAIRYVVNGSCPSLERATAICNALGIEFTIGVKDFSASTPTPDDFDSEHALIPRLDVRAAAGSGAINEYEQVSSHLAFRREWLIEHGLQAGRCAIIEVTGDSMEPLLNQGEVVLVDTAKRQPEHNQLAVVQTENGLLVKTIKKLDDKIWLLTSQNPDYDPIKFTARDRIIGHVADWKAGRIRAPFTIKQESSVNQYIEPEAEQGVHT